MSFGIKMEDTKKSYPILKIRLTDTIPSMQPYVRTSRILHLFIKNEVWFDCINGVEPLAFSPDKVFVKYGYGFLDYSWLAPENHYDIIGFNTDCCVLKVALDLFDRGYDFNVLTDYCYSSSGEEEHLRGVAVLKDLLGKLVK